MARSMHIRLRMILPFGCAAILITLCLLILLAWKEASSGFLPKTESTQVIESGRIYTLETSGNNVGGFRFLSSGESSNLQLVILRAESAEVRGGNGAAYLYGFEEYERLKIIDLSLFEQGDEIVISSLSASPLTFSYGTFVGHADDLAKTLDTYTIGQGVGIAAYVVMLLYAVSMYWFKQSEGYLRVFMTYLCAAIIIYFIRSNDFHPVSKITYYFFTTFCQGFECLVIIITCWLLLHHRHHRVPVFVWPILFAGSMLYAMLSTFSFNASIGEIAGLVLFLLPAVPLIRGCLNKIGGSWLLLVGWSVSAGIRLMLFCTILGIVDDWMAFSLLASTSLTSLPFALSCILFINRRYAMNYRMAEVLADELVKVNRTLDHRVEERTAEYVAECNQRHNMMLNIFHDLRSPLFVIKGCIDMLEAGAPDKKNLFEIIKERTMFLTEITENLFTLARLEDPQDDDASFPPSRVDVGMLLENAGSALRVLAKDKGVHLEITTLPDVTTRANCKRLEQAFQNLGDNALRYTPEGGVVSIVMEKRGSTCRIAFADTGCGIEKDKLDLIFTRYYQAGFNGKKGAAGLGLSIAKTIIERYGGTIAVESEIGKGSVFTVELPTTDQTAAQIDIGSQQKRDHQ